MKAELSKVCRRFILPRGIPATLREPYIPFVPRNWNGVLIVAEAQNHAGGNSGYLNKLKSLSPAERIARLYLDDRSIGVAPWDDGTLKLAIESAFGIDAAQTAVSNAVLWSLTKDKANRNPSKELQRESASVWSGLLPILKPRRIIAAGAVARETMLKSLSSNAELAPELNLWSLPSPRVLRPFSPMIREGMLLRRFPEVAEKVRIRKEWVEKDRGLKIFYACLAVSARGGVAPST